MIHFTCFSKYRATMRQKKTSKFFTSLDDVDNNAIIKSLFWQWIPKNSMLNKNKQVHNTWGSSDIILTVSSLRPTAKKRHLCSPTGTLPNAIQLTSDDICLRSVYSFNCPDYKGEKQKKLSCMQQNVLNNKIKWGVSFSSSP